MFSNTNNDQNILGGKTVSINSRQLTDLVQASIVYPKLQNVRNKEIKEASILYTYECNSNYCQFSPIVQQILASTLAESKKVREISATIVKELGKLPTASTTAGFIIQSGGGSIMYLENKSMKPTDEDYVGFIDVTEVRNRLIQEHQLQKEHKSHLKTALIGGTVGASFAVVVLGALKLARKL